MANGTDSDAFVLRSRVRPGLKRELAFALGQDSETKQSFAKLDILELIEKGDKVERETTRERRFTRSALKPKPEIAENEAVHLSSVSQKGAPLQLETTMPKITKKFRISELLGTGVLEGQRVTYRKGTKVRKADEEELTGVITGVEVVDKHLSILAKQHIETRFMKINAEKSPFLAEKLKIVVLPTLALIKNAKVDDYVVGFDELGGKDDFSTEELEERLARAQVIFFEGESSLKSSVKARSVRQSNKADSSDSE